MARPNWHTSWQQTTTQEEHKNKRKGKTKQRPEMEDKT
jgi:hypothetical protein